MEIAETEIFNFLNSLVLVKHLQVKWDATEKVTVTYLKRSLNKVFTVFQNGG